MAVFVSYARPDEPHAERVAEALRAKGYEVWRDDELPAHRAFSEVIEERLRDAAAVVVLWSDAASNSQWVRAEADTARNSAKLIQVQLDDTMPPLPFNQIQCADLRDWDGTETSGWRKLLTSVAALAGESKMQEKARNAGRDVSICVLPFQNMSGDSEQEYFSDGISEDITTDLSKVSALEVIARNTAFQFKGQSVDVSEIARKLGVTHVLEGSVRKAGSRVRITAQLIEGRSGGHIWADRYDRDLTDIFAIQDELSKAIVDALRLRLLPDERKAIENRGIANADAYNLYLMARSYWITGNWGDLSQLKLVIRICTRAIDIDANYARAWGLLALAECILHFTFNGTDADGLAAAERALSLDPKIAEAYCVRARHNYERGDFQAADFDLQRALELDPDSWEVNREAARIYYFQRRFHEAIRHYEKAVQADKTDFHTWGMLASAYKAIGDGDKTLRAARMAVENGQRVTAKDPMNGAALGMIVSGLAALGEHARVREWVDRALLLCPDNVIMQYNFACVLAHDLQDYDAAIQLLERLVPDFPPSALKALVADPDFDVLRDEPRFVKLMDFAETRLTQASSA